MRLNLADKVHSNLHHDEQGCTTQNKRHANFTNQQFRQNAQADQVDGSDYRQTGNYIVKILGSIFPWTNTGNKAAMLL
mgnify:CR=1 FL=1